MDSPNTLVRELRLGAGLSQRALARRAGTSQPAIARYERGVATPSWGTLQRLATGVTELEGAELGRPKDTAALPALYATREALRRRRREGG